MRHSGAVISHRWPAARNSGAWGLTEPNAGSDASGTQTTAVLDGDEWVLNGSKIFITQGSVADIYVIMAATEKSQKQHGISAFIVERGTPGLSAIPMKNKFGVRASDTAQITLDDVRIPQGKPPRPDSMRGLSTR